MNNNLKQFKEMLRSIELSQHERENMRKRLLLRMEQFTGQQSVASPYVHHSFILRPLQSVALALVVIISGGSGLVFASQDTLPGDALYNFKVNVVEEVVALQKRTPEAKAKHAIDRAALRLDETTELALAGKLDESAKKSISAHIKQHTDEARKYSDHTKQDNLQLELQLAAQLESSLSSRTELLTEIKVEKELNGELSGILEVTQENIEISNQEKKNVEAELVKTVPASDTEKARVLVKESSVLSQLASFEKQIVTLVDTNEPEATEEPVEVDLSLEKTEVEPIDLAEEQKPLTLIEKKTAIKETLATAQLKIKEEQFGEAWVLLQEAETQLETARTLIELKASIDEATNE